MGAICAVACRLGFPAIDTGGKRTTELRSFEAILYNVGINMK